MFGGPCVRAISLGETKRDGVRPPAGLRPPAAGWQPGGTLLLTCGANRNSDLARMLDSLLAAKHVGMASLLRLI